MPVLRLKRRASGGAAGAPASLATTEPAYNETDDILYLGYGDSGGGVATSIKVIAGAGAFVDKTTAQTIAGTKTFSTAPVVGTLANTDTSTSAASTAHVKSVRLDQFAAPTTSVSLNSQKITSLATPTADADAANKSYVDSVAQGLDVKPSALAATTANITLSAPQTIDGIAVVAGNRVLVKNQSTASQNGIYVVAAGAWSRALDADTWAKLPGAFLFVETGTVNADSGWVCTSDAGGTLGTTAVDFTQFSGAGDIIAGAGLTKTGNTIDAVGTSNRITVAADSIDIASTYVGQTSITTLGTIATGSWTATDVAIEHGGTGRSTGTTAYSLIATGTTATGAQQTLANGLTTQLLVGGGASALPVWTVATGTGAPVRATTPTLVTPVLGVASATSINKVAITAPATGSTLTIADGKTLTVSNTLTLTATDASTLAIGTGGTLGTAAYTASTAYSPVAGSASITTVGTIATGTWNATAIAANKGGTGQTAYAVGDLLYASTTSALSKLVAGTSGDVLTVSAGLPTWSSTIEGGTF